MLTHLSLITSVLCAGLLVIFLKDAARTSIKLLLSFSGAYILAICFLHLIPEVYAEHSVQIGLFVLLGFLIQLFLEFMSEGIEHGHIHYHGDGHDHSHRFPYIAFLSLCIHALLEGMPLDDGSGHDHHAHENGATGNPLLIGIVLHKIPVSIALMTLIIESGLGKWKALGYLFIFSLMAPAGILINHFWGTGLSEEFPLYFTAILAIVVGMLLHISTTILFEASDGHGFNLRKLVSIILGGVIAYLTLI